MKNGNIKNLMLSLAVAALATLTACGGGGGGGATVTTTTTTPATSTTTAVVTTTPTAVVTTTPTSVVTTTPTSVVTPPVIGATPVYTLANPPGSSYAVGSAQRAMFTSLNQTRIGGGFGALEQDTRLDQAAQAHADYVIDAYYPNGVEAAVTSTLQPNGVITIHTETQGVNGFTGASLVNRIAVTGYQAVTFGEVIAAQFGTKVGVEPEMSVCLSNLINSVFHRAGLLDTNFLDIGFGISKSATNKNGFILRTCVINTASKQAAPILAQGWTGIYPFDLQTNLPLVMVKELPDPVPSSPIKGGPINIQVSGGQTLLVNNFVLRDASGIVFNTKILTRADTNNLPATSAYLVPLSALMPNTTYTVTFSGTSNGTIINRTWSFKTAAN